MPAAAEWEILRIIGSSTMYNFLAEAAEDFGRDIRFRAPGIEAIHRHRWRLQDLLLRRWP